MPGREEIGLRLLEWSGGRSGVRARSVRRRKIPELRILHADEEQGLFEYASTMNSTSGFWETIAFVALSVFAAGALIMAFL